MVTCSMKNGETRSLVGRPKMPIYDMCPAVIHSWIKMSNCIATDMFVRIYVSTSSMDGTYDNHDKSICISALSSSLVYPPQI
jgi:hypothetical protein